MSETIHDGPGIEGKMHFLLRNQKYEYEKPYTMRYAPSAEDGIAQTNIEPVQFPVRFHDMRNKPDLEYDTCGFAVITLDKDSMAYQDYESTEKVEGTHATEVLQSVKEALAAASTELIDYVVRRRHTTWPIATGSTYKFQQPASRAHIDHTYGGGVDIVRTAYGNDADRVLGRRWQLVNVWHPLRGPLVDWPLAVCDMQTVDFENDTMAGDVVDRDQVFENTQVHFNAGQQWYYLSGQMPNELIVFKNADSEEPIGVSPGVPHGSFDHPHKSSQDFLRESIEMRVLVCW